MADYSIKGFLEILYKIWIQNACKIAWCCVANEAARAATTRNPTLLMRWPPECHASLDLNHATLPMLCVHSSLHIPLFNLWKFVRKNCHALNYGDCILLKCDYGFGIKFSPSILFDALHICIRGHVRRSSLLQTKKRSERGPNDYNVKRGSRSFHNRSQMATAAGCVGRL